MAKKYEVDSLFDALKLAENFKNNGTYNLFRGQARNWDVTPSAGRISESQLEIVKGKLERLYLFFDSDPVLKKYTNNIDSFFAIAQHYGIPTNYIDFTTSFEVAAFFATNSKYNVIGEEAVIICLNENHFNDVIEFSKVIYLENDEIPPYISKVHVDNLWRLQAQKGCFLFTPFPEMEFYYGFDRIIFPFYGSYNSIEKIAIYPDRKSELEILLDQYFNTERKIEGQKRLRLFAIENNASIHTIPPQDHNVLLKQNLIHNSWASESFKDWYSPIVEEWSTKEFINISIDTFFDKNLAADQQILIIKKELSIFFNEFNISRQQPLTFQINATPKISKKTVDIINRSCVRIWDGTRNLPYTNDEIITMISTYIYLEYFNHKCKFPPNLINDNYILLEIVNEYGSVIRCYSSSKKIANSFRADIKDILVSDLCEKIDSQILLWINNPKLIFDFKKLLQLFKDELIPYQVLSSSRDENPVVFYTPTQINALGYA